MRKDLEMMCQIMESNDEIEFINLTPHKVTISGRDFPPSGQTARVQELRKSIGEIGGHDSRLVNSKKLFSNIINSFFSKNKRELPK